MPEIWLGQGRRSRVQIAAAVLRLSKSKDTTRSELMECVKMSHQQTQVYIEWLVELQLLNIIETGPHRQCYRSTPRGQKLVTIIEKVQRMLAGR